MKSDKFKFLGGFIEIRQEKINDINRIAEIEIFNYRLNFYPIFRNADFYFNELQVLNIYNIIKQNIDTYFVYDDGVIKGFIQKDGFQLKKLFVEPVLQNNSIGTKLLIYAIEELKLNYLWALEKNAKVIKFYKTNGFKLTDEKILEDATSEYLVKLVY
jgi:putative acetyltransferase